MRIEIEIPKEFEKDYTADKFADFLGRVKADIDYNGMCGNYERETADVLAEAFKNSRVVRSVAYKGGRLIDADAFERKVMCGDEEDVQDVIYSLRDFPAAYDVDAVVAQLEEEEEHSHADFESYAEEHGIDSNDDWHYAGLKRAIEIVKVGGAE